MATLDEISRRVDALETSGKPRKSWFESAAIPLAIALTGIVSTWFVTQAQLATAEKIATANRDAANQTSQSQERLKALELHIKYIADPDPSVRESGVILLSVIDPELASRLKEVLRKTEKDPKV